MHKIYLLGLTGMNYGNASTMEIEETGELKAMHYVKNKIIHKTGKIIFFDVGANVGDYSNALHELFQTSNLEIFAFEPSQGTYLQLKENTQKLSQIHLQQFALGSQEEDTKIYFHFQASGATTLYNQGLSSFSAQESISEDISIRTIDHFCSENQISEIDFIKIDVEGHELQVLLGGNDMLLRKKIRFIQFEFGSFHVHSRTFFKDFWDLLHKDYYIFRIISDGLFEIKGYNENLEIFRTSNFIAELKS